ncbi:Chaperone protein papD precursor [Serratia fonticola]|uniref:Chaperone protein papD n=1 Tax=Serratia fonticola TaxID=47917 RepID=A0A3S4WZ46_SERFO|nr:Chaperone protein papD precursor [Serratia fonticola]
MNVMKNPFLPLTGGLLIGVLGMQQAQAAIALDRTRVVFSGAEKSVSLSISNENKQLPYLAQGWVEDAQGNKITTPLTVLPPLQRLEPGAKSQVKVQALPAANLLAQDRETLFYFNLREIPPKSDKPNTLQLALQTRIKLFYRPKALSNTEGAAPWQEQLTLTKQGDKYQVNNPTPYYVTIVEASGKPGGAGAKGFEPLMVSPKGKAMLNLGVSVLGNAPVLTYVNDYGGRPQLQFSCGGADCKAKPVKQG